MWLVARALPRFLPVRGAPKSRTRGTYGETTNPRMAADVRRHVDARSRWRRGSARPRQLAGLEPTAESPRAIREWRAHPVRERVRGVLGCRRWGLRIWRAPPHRRAIGTVSVCTQRIAPHPGLEPAGLAPLLDSSNADRR